MQTCVAPSSRIGTSKTGRNHPKEWVEPRPSRLKKHLILLKPRAYYGHQPQNRTVLRPLTSIWIQKPPKGSEVNGRKFNS